MTRAAYETIVRELACDPLVVRTMLSQMPTRSILSEPDKPKAPVHPPPHRQNARKA
jgi:hypothetical protein